MIEIFKEKTNVDNGTRIIPAKETKLSSAENVKWNNTHENRTKKAKQIEFTDKIRKFPWISTCGTDFPNILHGLFFKRYCVVLTHQKRQSMKIKHQKNIHKFNCFYKEIQNLPEMCHKVIESNSEAWITTLDDQTVGGYISLAGHSIFAVLAIIQGVLSNWHHFAV